MNYIDNIIEKNKKEESDKIILFLEKNDIERSVKIENFIYNNRKTYSLFKDGNRYILLYYYENKSIMYLHLDDLNCLNQIKFATSNNQGLLINAIVLFNLAILLGYKIVKTDKYYKIPFLINLFNNTFVRFYIYSSKKPDITVIEELKLSNDIDVKVDIIIPLDYCYAFNSASFNNFLENNFDKENITIKEFANKNIILLSKKIINKKYVNFLHKYDYGFIYYYNKIFYTKCVLICEI